MTSVSAPKKRAISLASSASSVWLMVAKTPRTTQARDEILGANAELLGQILYRNAFGDGDVPRDRQRLIADASPAAAECSPSSGLPSRRAERISVPAGVTDAPGRAPGRLGPGGAIGAPGPTPSGRAPAGATRVGCIGRRSPGRSGGRAPGRLLAARYAGKLAAQARAVPALDAWALPGAGAALCTPDAVQSAA